MERIGIYTGTFNPPHTGHLRGAQYALEALQLDRMLLIPDGVAPHKQLPQGSASAQQRLQMLRLCVQDYPGLEVNAFAADREQVTYTWQTVEKIRRDHPDARLYLLLGSDMLQKLPQWKMADKLLAEVSVAVLCRDDQDRNRATALCREQLEAMGTQVYLLDNPVTDISSTQLRRMLVFRCAGEYLCESVERYIYQHGLYGTGENYRGLPIGELEQTVVRLLKPNRVAHVLGCRQAAVELAERYGADPVDAARAALLHDVTKALDGPLQLTLCREYGTILNTFSFNNPKTLHALTGSLVAQRIFGETDAVVAAIRCHTTGKANMNLLEKIVYVADYMEPNRDFPGVERLRALAYTNITQALKLGLEMTLDMLRQQGREISPESTQALHWLQTEEGTL